MWRSSAVTGLKLPWFWIKNFDSGPTRSLADLINQPSLLKICKFFSGSSNFLPSASNGEVHIPNPGYFFRAFFALSRSFPFSAASTSVHLVQVEPAGHSWIALHSKLPPRSISQMVPDGHEKGTQFHAWPLQLHFFEQLSVKTSSPKNFSLLRHVL